MDKVEIFKDDAGEYRWHRKAPNGEIIADSGEGYQSRNECLVMAGRVNSGVPLLIMEDE